MAVKIVTDSTGDLPPQVVQELDITVVPLNVNFGEESFQDGVDLDSDGFFQRLTTEARLPTTSQPSVGAFLETYRGLLEGGHEVVSVHISAKLSGTMNSALQAREQLDAGDRLAVVDSQQVGLALGVVATAVAQAVKDGASYAETVDLTPRISERVRLFVLLETLEYLQRGGRIGRAQAFLGSLLHIRPILTVREGEVHPLERVRARQRGLERLYQLAAECGPLQQVGICHSTTPEDALALAERMQPALAGGRLIQARFGPVLGTHVGPGAIAITVQAAE
jgi:DegV family protein with EDD domain